MRCTVFVLALSTIVSPQHAIAANYWASHWQRRDAAIERDARTTGAGHVVLLGDSNTEAFKWSRGSCRFINAGYDGATVETLAERAERIAGQTRPTIVHIMIGTNNLFARNPYDPDRIAADLHRIASAFVKFGTKIVFWRIPPMSRESAPPDYQARRRAIDALIAREAAALKPYNGFLGLDWWWPRQLDDQGGYAREGTLRNDGIHLALITQVSRYSRIERWNTYIEARTRTDCRRTNGLRKQSFLASAPLHSLSPADDNPNR